MRSASLRVRLFVVILTPLLLMAIVLGLWRFHVAQQTAEELFDRNLLSAALAISRDVAISGGDALLPSTSDLIRDASGGEVFYHATGPGGIYVTGYAYPPANSSLAAESPYSPDFFEAAYRGDDVRVLQITERVTIDGLLGDATVTVWQRISDRQAFATQLAIRAASLIGMLLVTLGLVVWFGVARGLRPLLDLEDAIAMRSPDDLSRIKRAVPVEAEGIVKTLNRLFGKVEASIVAHQSFISDAAHQLRNPAAAVQSLAESLRDAPTAADQSERVEQLVSAARNSARVAEQLLSLDRLKQPLAETATAPFDLALSLRELCAEVSPAVLSRGVEFALFAPDESVTIDGDRLFMDEAIKNLIDNAMKHGGKGLTQISVTLATDETQAFVTVWDDGKSLRPEDSKTAFSRFAQVEPSNGSGLGLAIALSVAERHGGKLTIDAVEQGASLTMRLPLA